MNKNTEKQNIEKIQYEIEKGVEMPVRASRAPKYPWAEMQNGDSFKHPLSLSSAVSSANGARKIKGNENKKFVAREKDGVVRVWRVK